MKKLIVRRGLAFGIDYLIIGVYAILLFVVASLCGVENFDPIEGQFVGFITLTLPVFLYFFLTERSKHRATIGKRLVRISVSDDHPDVNGNIFARNVLKFMPWEIAHVGVHWIVYYSNEKLETPNWVWLSLILPQAIIFGYVISILLYKGKYAIYDRIAKTKIEIN